MNDISDLSKQFLQDLFDLQCLDFSTKMLPKNCSELALLGLLSRYQSLTSGEITKKLQLKTSRTAALLKALEEKDQIKRTPSKEDKRIIYVSLTPQGEEICQKGIKCLLKRIEDAYEKVGIQEMEQFKSTLKKICEIEKENHLCSDSNASKKTI